MAVRNFWIDTRIDGRKTDLSSGPRSRDGGFLQTIYMRDRGSILAAVSIRAYTHSDGTLTVEISAPRDSEHVRVTTLSHGLIINTDRD
ncbi:hypothetical protein LCGC14_1259900 [marine sediment metagenome]|uniref:Uncharacterized protein n=1 Tax=marine sediment metagenome TaxID=412755 RepID=A0A0F9NHP2_9ZZZZ